MNARPKTSTEKTGKPFSKPTTPIRARCELDTLPPICENEHMTGNCYCHLCTCDLHSCPGEYKRKLLSSQSHYKTHYSRNFPKKWSEYTLHKPIPEFRPAQYAFNSQSTTQKEFYKPEIIKSEICGPGKVDYVPRTFFGKTSYSNDYGKYVETYPEKEYVMEFDYPRRETKMLNKSAYGENFVDPTLKNYEENRVLEKRNRTHSRGDKSLITTYTGFLGKSTQKSAFMKINPKKPKMYGGHEPILETPDFRCEFTSTYKQSFVNPVFALPAKKKFAKNSIK